MVLMFAPEASPSSARTVQPAGTAPPPACGLIGIFGVILGGEGQ